MNGLNKALTFSYRAFGKLSRVSLKLSRKFEPKNIQELNVRNSTNYDMVKAPDEPYYAEQYWTHITPYLNELPSETKSLDLGCSQGRFTLMLAKQFPNGHSVGCDLSPESIEQAKVYAQEEGIENAEFHAQSINEYIQNVESNAFDVIFMTEVTIFYPQWKEDLPKILQSLKPGGLLVLSFRSQYFNSLIQVRQKNFEGAKEVLEKRDGAIFGAATVYSWNTSKEIKEFHDEQNEIELLKMAGIGTCSGIPGDPHNPICQPSELTQSERKKLLEIELGLSESVPDGGRYILSIARKIL